MQICANRCTFPNKPCKCIIVLTFYVRLKIVLLECYEKLFWQIILVRLNTLAIIPCRNWTQGRTWENLSSEEKEQFLEEVLGSEHKYGNVQVWFPSILYPIISLLGIPGNLLTCLSIYKIPYMRTSSNFFIFNLALSDLLSLSFGNYELFRLNDVE